MKRMKKIASLVLAMVMALAMTMTAFATSGTGVEGNQGTGATTGTTTGHTYELFQIFTGDYSAGVLSNIKWGVNGKYIAEEGQSSSAKIGEKVPKAVLDVLTGLKDVTDTTKLATITQYVNLNGIPFSSEQPIKSDSEGKVTYTYSNLAPGYYLVRDMAKSLDNQEGQSYTLYVVGVTDGTLTFTPKGDVPTVDKKIVEETTTTTGEGDDQTTTTTEEKVKANAASIGDTIKYEIVGKMPSNIADYKTYYYKFTDTLSKGLDFAGVIKENVEEGEGNVDSGITVKIGNTKVTQYFYKNVTKNATTGETTIVVSIADIKAFANLNPAISITEATEVVITYDATLNENAVIGKDPNKNTVDLTYSNNPNDSGEGTTNPPKDDPKEPTTTHPTGETPKTETETFTTELTILKTDETGKKFLPGTEFTLTGNGVNIVLVTEQVFKEDDNGTYWKLKDGTYTTTAPVMEDTDEVKNNKDDYESTSQKYSLTTATVLKSNDKDDDGKEKGVVGTVNEEGEVTFTGLGAGDYTLTESKTLPGYNTISPITFKVEFDKNSKKFSVAKNSDGTASSVTVSKDKDNNEVNTLGTIIVNQSGSTLPSTGGIGTTIFYVVGGILVIGAGILLVVKKRMGNR